MKNLLSLKSKKVRNSLKYFYVATVALFSITTIATDVNVREDEIYTDVDHIAMYIYEFDELPPNYIPKEQSSTIVDDDLYLYTEYRNDNEVLPDGYLYTEAYINAKKGDVGGERIVYTIGSVYYTDNHYESFEYLTTEEIQETYNRLLITTSLFTLGGPAAFAIAVESKDNLSYTLIKEDTLEDYKYIKNKISLGYNKVKDKLLKKDDQIEL